MKKSTTAMVIALLSASSVFANGNEKKHKTVSANSESSVSIRSFEPRPGFDLVIAPDTDVLLDIFDESGNIVFHQYLHDHSGISKVYNLSKLPDGIYRVKTKANKITSNQFITVKNQ